MPRFEFEASTGLADVLKDLGMAIAFQPPAGDSGADFSGMDGRRDLFIRDVLHKAFVAVDEAGTEAAASTAVLAEVTSAPPVATLVVDRPFVFLVQDRETGAILFLGRVVDPMN
jgi:serpin B